MTDLRDLVKQERQKQDAATIAFWMALLFAFVVIGLIIAAWADAQEPEFPGLFTLENRPYQRREYLPRWPSEPGDCRDLRSVILTEKSLVPVATNRNGCRVLSGLWIGHYSGERFTRWREVDIEHIVALSEAHRKGAWRWSLEEKRRFATDYGVNLIVVSASLNRGKGDQGPEKWLPPKYSCYYLQVLRRRVLIKYHLDRTEDEAKIAELGCEL